MTSPARQLDRFYDLLGHLREGLGGERKLFGCTGRTGWPARGVYFFCESGEVRRDGSPRVVRVGTHALTAGSRTTLWQRLSQHRGTVSGPDGGGGNHRGSVFRLHVGAALLGAARDGPFRSAVTTWGHGSTADREVRAREHGLEVEVSRVIGAMPLLWVAVDDPPGPGSDRAAIESGAIALLSALSNPDADPASPTWLGRHADRCAVRDSGLWNVRHVTDAPAPSFLEVLSRRIEETLAR